MTQDGWTLVDRYITNLLVPHDDALAEAMQANAAAGLPPSDVTPNQGKFLMLLARLQGARRILELGTLGGYSTIWLARLVSNEPRVDGTALQTVGSKGHDGFALVLVNANPTPSRTP
jgi:predicted O-methyltransferase YrrM